MDRNCGAEPLRGMTRPAQAFTTARVDFQRQEHASSHSRSSGRLAAWLWLDGAHAVSSDRFISYSEDLGRSRGEAAFMQKKGAGRSPAPPYVHRPISGRSSPRRPISKASFDCHSRPLNAACLPRIGRASRKRAGPHSSRRHIDHQHYVAYRSPQVAWVGKISIKDAHPPHREAQSSDKLDASTRIASFRAFGIRDDTTFLRFTSASSATTACGRRDTASRRGTGAGRRRIPMAGTRGRLPTLAVCAGDRAQPIPACLPDCAQAGCR